MSTSASSPPVRVPFSEEAAENDSDLPGMDAGLDRQSGLLYVDDSIVRDLNDARGHVDLGAAYWRRQLRAFFNVGDHLQDDASDTR